MNQLSLEVIGKVEKANQLIREVVEELEKVRAISSDEKTSTYYRLKKVRSLLYLILKYWGE